MTTKLPVAESLGVIYTNPCQPKPNPLTRLDHQPGKGDIRGEEMRQVLVTIWPNDEEVIRRFRDEMNDAISEVKKVTGSSEYMPRPWTDADVVCAILSLGIDRVRELKAEILRG